MKSKRYTIIGIVAIVNLIFFVAFTPCGKGILSIIMCKHSSRVEEC